MGGGDGNSVAMRSPVERILGSGKGESRADLVGICV